MACTITRQLLNPMATKRIINCNDLNAVEEAVKILRTGSVIGVPTDTVYGLAVHAKNSQAINKLYGIKHRELEKPIAISVAEVNDISRWAHTSHLPNDLLQTLLPGAVTVVLPRKNSLNPLLNPNSSLVGVRVPGSSFIQKVAYKLGDAIALTSANLSSEPSPLNIEEFKHLWCKLDGIFDGGPIINTRKGSTVIDLSIPGEYSVIRTGSALDSTITILNLFKLKLGS